ncbi:MAG: nickel pincer cofactor biosynthesis protein LarC [Nitrospirae bacterium]|nr:nickel pincer cofactor biosynthesis protein LarC [Nitrospirota bacterium]
MKNRILYLDCVSGISGDMCLAALVDSGVPFEELVSGLKGLDIEGYRMEKKEVKKSGLRACKIEIIVTQHRPYRHFKDVREIIRRSHLPDKVKNLSLKAFKQLFEAEAKVHGADPEKIHLHELSAVDCFIDIVGTFYCLDYLRIEEALCSPVNLGGGVVETEHGVLPVPAPATVELLRGWPVYSRGIKRELTTPTGAVILSTAFKPSDTIPMMEIESVGYGAGSMDIEGYPNVLRAITGRKGKEENIRDSILHIETNIDDMNPQVYEYLMERLFEKGALDVYLTQIIMKKSRPGVILNVLCDEDKLEEMTEILLGESTTIGVRFRKLYRQCLDREIREIETKWGRVRFKLVQSPGGTRCSPEYEDCKKIARERGIPLTQVIQTITSMAEELIEGQDE